MKYWDQMADPKGFGAGTWTPADARAARKAYVIAVNALLEERGAASRVVPLPEEDGQNKCMLALVEEGELPPGVPMFLRDGRAHPAMGRMRRWIVEKGDENFTEVKEALDRVALDRSVETLSMINAGLFQECLEVARAGGSIGAAYAGPRGLSAVAMLAAFVESQEGERAIGALAEVAGKDPDGPLADLLRALRGAAEASRAAAAGPSPGGGG